jgi:RNA-binding protein YhbY
MAKMSEKQLRKRDAKRNLGEELLQAARQMKAGRAARVHQIEVPARINQMTAIKRVLVSQLEDAMKQRKLTKIEMARRMRTSRVQLDRLFDPDNDSVTLATLRRAAAIVGREIRLELT